MGPQVTHTLIWLDYKSEVPMILSSGLVICYKGSQDSGKYFTYYYQFIVKDIIKVTNVQLNEDVHKVRSRKVLSAGTSIPMEFGVCYFPDTWIHSPTWKVLESYYPGFFMKVSLCRHKWLNHWYWPLTEFLALLPSLKIRNVAENSNLLITCLVLLAIVIQSYPAVSTLAQTQVGLEGTYFE